MNSSCKCGAENYLDHLQRVNQGYPAHVYLGFYWGWGEDEASW